MINQELEHRTLLHDEVAISLTGTSSWKCEATYDSISLKITCSCNRLQKFGFCCKEIIRVLMLLQQHVPQYHDAKTFTNAISSHVAERWNKCKSPSQDALVTKDRQAASLLPAIVDFTSAPCNLNNQQTIQNLQLVIARLKCREIATRLDSHVLLTKSVDMLHDCGGPMPLVSGTGIGHLSTRQVRGAKCNYEPRKKGREEKTKRKRRKEPVKNTSEDKKIKATLICETKK